MKARDLPRFGKMLNVLKHHSVISKVLVDLGCNDGKLTMEMARLLRPEEIYCIDIDKNALNIARSRELKTYKADLSSNRSPIQDGSADLVTALEVIEHLVNPDNMLREAYRIRILRNHGYLLITTPNLASWVNRLVMLLGYQPYNCEISTEMSSLIYYHNSVVVINEIGKMTYDKLIDETNIYDTVVAHDYKIK